MGRKVVSASHSSAILKLLPDMTHFKIQYSLMNAIYQKYFFIVMNFYNLFIYFYLFIYGCVGSSFLREGFL